MIRIAFLASLLILAVSHAKAASCSSVVPGAQIGPSPNFRTWPWANACYISWPGGYVDGQNARHTYEAKCKQVPGFLHFEGDFGSNENTCVFRLAQNPPSEPSPPIATAKRNPPTQDEFFKDPDLLYEDGIWGLPPIPKSNWPKARERTAEAEHYFRKGMYTLTEISFLSPIRSLVQNDAESEKVIKYLKCMSVISTVLKHYHRDNKFQLLEAEDVYRRCKGVSGELSSDGVVKVTNIHREMGSTQPPDPRQITSASPPQGTIDTHCLVVRQPRDTGVGCGNGRTWKMTYVAVSTIASNLCPSSVKFFYNDEDGPEIAEAPTKLQTCGAPPLNVRTSK